MKISKRVFGFFMVSLIIALSLVPPSLTLDIKRKRKTNMSYSKMRNDPPLLDCNTVFADAKFTYSKDTQQLPNVFQTDPAIIAKAKSQTTAARKLLYKPNDVAKGQMSIAAAKLKAMVNLLDSWDGKDWNNTFFNRQIEGLQLETKKNSKNEQLAILGRIQNKNGTGYDHAAFLALIGDVGTAIDDYAVKFHGKNCDTDYPLPKDKKDKGECKAFKPIFDQFLSTASIQTITNKAEAMVAITRQMFNERSGNAITNCRKKKERGIVFEGADPQQDPPRSGVFDLNKSDAIDSTLGITENKIPPTRWPYQKMPEGVMTACAEPWAGHYSGSVLEIMMVFDWLTFVSSNDANLAHPLLSFNYDYKDLKRPTTMPQLDDEKRKARAILSAAFLVGGGYHTANEVYYSIKKYLGDSTVKTKKEAFCDTNATTKFNELCGEFTK